MADQADRALGIIELEINNRITNTRADIPPGHPGDCDDCGEWAGRLIEGRCAPCRDLEETRNKRMIGRVGQ